MRTHCPKYIAAHHCSQVAKASPEVPFFVYSGMNIVHPPYRTNEYWNDKIDRSKVRATPSTNPYPRLTPTPAQS